MSQESIWLFALLVAGAVGLSGAAMAAVRRAKRLHDCYASIGRDLQGVARSDFWLDKPAVSFVHHEMPALLTAANDIVRLDSTAPSLAHSLWHTQLHIGWPDTAARCEIFSRPALWQRLLGGAWRDFETGTAVFDRRYVVRGDSLQVLREFLTCEVQNRIQDIRYLGPNNDVYIGLGGGILTIRKRGILRDLDDLQRFTSLGLQLFDEALRGSRAEELHARQIGIEFLQPAALQPPDGARCPLCGEAIDGIIVYCHSCRTPHHAECWRYFGACSTYGCGEQQFTAIVSFRNDRETISIGDDDPPPGNPPARAVRAVRCRDAARRKTASMP